MTDVDPTPTQARHIHGDPTTESYLPSRVLLRRPAEAMQRLIMAVRQVVPAYLPAIWPRRRRLKWPSLNTARVTVFAVALITLVVAASLPRT